MNETAGEATRSPKGNLRIYVTILLMILGVVGCVQLNQYLARLPDGVDVRMQKHADLAVDLAQERFDINLDYSPESVEQVEQILGQFRERYQENPPSDGISFRSYYIWGAYIGEVIRKLKGGEWYEYPDSPRVTLRFMENDEQQIIEPTFWCYQRVDKGRPEDNVWYNFLLVTVEPDPSQLRTPPPQQGVPGQ